MIASLLRTLRSRAERLKNRRLHAIYHEFRSDTMTPRAAYVHTLSLANGVGDVDGCVVECGAWRGGMTAGMARILGTHRHYVLFDSFEGLPPARDVDGPAAQEWQADTSSPGYHDNCRADASAARSAMVRAGIASPEIVVGWFETTVPAWAAAEGTIAVLRLDGDWYDSVMICLQQLFPLVATGGLIVIDDYGHWDGCTRAVHRYLSDHERAESIQSTTSGVTYIRKR